MTVGGMIVVALFAIGLAITFMTARLAERSYTARGVALRLVAALFLTVPVCVAAAKFVDGSVSDAFLYAFLAISFMLAILLQWTIERGFRRRLVRRRTYAPRIWQSESLASKETRHVTPWVTVGRTPLDPSSSSPVSPESEDVVSNEIRQVALQVPDERTPPIDQRSEVQGEAPAESLASKETRHVTPGVTVGRPPLDLSSHSPASSESEDVVSNEIRQVVLQVPAERTPPIDQRSEVQGEAPAESLASKETRFVTPGVTVGQPPLDLSSHSPVSSESEDVVSDEIRQVEQQVPAERTPPIDQRSEVQGTAPAESLASKEARFVTPGVTVGRPPLDLSSHSPVSSESEDVVSDEIRQVEQQVPAERTPPIDQRSEVQGTAPAESLASKEARLATPWVTFGQPLDLSSHSPVSSESEDVVSNEIRQVALLVPAERTPPIDQRSEVQGTAPAESLASKETRLVTPWVTVGQPPLDLSSHSPVSSESEDAVSDEIRQVVLQVPAERTPPIDQRSEVQGIAPAESLASKEARLVTPWVTVGQPPLDLSSHSPVSSESEDIVSNEIRQVALLVPAERTPPIDQRLEVQGEAPAESLVSKETRQVTLWVTVGRPTLDLSSHSPVSSESEDVVSNEIGQVALLVPAERTSSIDQRSDVQGIALAIPRLSGAKEELKEQPISRSDALNRALRKLQDDSSGVVASALISEDGLMIASVLAPYMEESRVAGMTATLLNLGSRAAIELKRGGVSEIIVRGDQGYAVLINASRRTLLLALTDESAKLGLIFIDMREAVQTIAKVL